MSESEAGGIQAQALLRDAQDLAPDAFAKKHGAHFLLGTRTSAAAPAGPRSTQLVGLSSMDQTQMASTAGVGQQIFALRRTERSIGAFVSIGRTLNNDVVVPDVTVSRFHAFVKTPEGEAPRIQDAGSTNGTLVNGKPVPTQAEGVPVALSTGDDVRIGSVDFTYLEAAALQDFLRMMSG